MVAVVGASDSVGATEAPGEAGEAGEAAPSGRGDGMGMENPGILWIFYGDLIGDEDLCDGGMGMENDGDDLMMNYLVNSDILELEAEEWGDLTGMCENNPKHPQTAGQNTCKATIVGPQAWNISPGMGVKKC